MHLLTMKFFLQVELGDEDNYACKIWDKTGQKTWRNFTVSIANDNEIEQKPETTKLQERQCLTLGSKHCGTYFIFIVAPYWVKPETEMVETLAIPVGRRAKFVCKANGLPQPFVKWYKDEVELNAESRKGLENKVCLRKVEPKNNQNESKIKAQLRFRKA